MTESDAEPKAPEQGAPVNHHTFALTVDGALDQAAHDRISAAIRLAAEMTVKELGRTGIDNAGIDRIASCGGCNTG